MTGRMIGTAEYAHHTNENTKHYERIGKGYQKRRESCPKKMKADQSP